MLEVNELEQFISELPGHVVVVLDEAYYEFAAYFAEQRKVEYSRSLTYVRQGASVVVLRTFSKTHGLAGLRIGYGLGPAELLSYCRRMQDTYSVSSVAQAAALAALDDEDHVARSVSHNAEQAQKSGSAACPNLGSKSCRPGRIFSTANLGRMQRRSRARLREEGVSVRPLGAWGAPTCIRVSIGTAQQNDNFLEAMRKLLVATSSQGR